MAKELHIYGNLGIPTVTKEDEGKILKVQDGQWSKGDDETADALSNLEIEALLNNFI